MSAWATRNELKSTKPLASFLPIEKCLDPPSTTQTMPTSRLLMLVWLLTTFRGPFRGALHFNSVLVNCFLILPIFLALSFYCIFLFLSSLPLVSYRITFPGFLSLTITFLNSHTGYFRSSSTAWIQTLEITGQEICGLPPLCKFRGPFSSSLRGPVSSLPSWNSRCFEHITVTRSRGFARGLSK